MSDSTLEKALDFGIDFYDIDLRPTFSEEARRIVRDHHGATEAAGKEELFFALAIAVLHTLGRHQVRTLLEHAQAYHRSGSISAELLRSFAARVQQLSPDGKADPETRLEPLPARQHLLGKGRGSPCDCPLGGRRTRLVRFWD